MTIIILVNFFLDLHISNAYWNYLINRYSKPDYESIIFHINEFNKYFYRFGIHVEESEVKVECLGELEKIENILKEQNEIKQQIKQNQIHEIELRYFSWLERWMKEDSKYLNWLEDWLHYDKSNLVLT